MLSDFMFAGPTPEHEALQARNAPTVETALRKADEWARRSGRWADNVKDEAARRSAVMGAELIRGLYRARAEALARSGQ